MCPSLRASLFSSFQECEKGRYHLLWKLYERVSFSVVNSSSGDKGLALKARSPRAKGSWVPPSSRALICNKQLGNIGSAGSTSHYYTINPYPLHVGCHQRHKDVWYLSADFLNVLKHHLL